MTMNEFGEIREAWTELIAIYDEMDGLNAGQNLPAVIEDYPVPAAAM